MDHEAIFRFLGMLVIVSPTTLLAVLGITALVGQPLSEAAVSRWTFLSVMVGLAGSVLTLLLMLLWDTRHVPLELGNWMNIPEQHFHFHLKFVFDRLSIPFIILTQLLCGTIGAFTHRYLHREPGFLRFYIAFAIFTLGMVVSSLAGTIEVLFFGWELVGLSSALLVAYFHERISPVTNGLRVWSVYRVADAAFLIAAVIMHHMTGAGDFDGLMGTGPWPEGHASLSSAQALSVGLLLLVAVAGKSGLVPFSGWLPRAMEGPTPSSAIFYGALSVHLGAYLLLRVSPLLEVSPFLCGCIVLLGVTTAVFAAGASRVQADVKSALAFASLTQVGIIVAEIGLGFRYLALIHIIGHACLRTLQLLRAPTLLHDYGELENASGARLDGGVTIWEKLLPAKLRATLYGIALQRAYLDNTLDRYVVAPFRATFEWCDRAENRWTDWLSGGRSREADHRSDPGQVFDDLAG